MTATPAIVIAFVAYLQAHGIHVEDKRTSLLMQRAAEQMEQSQLATSEDFRNRFATTVFRTIFLPFAPGVPDEVWTLEQQLAVIAHESIHVDQYNRLGIDVMVANYGTSAGRAMLECEAYAVQALVMQALGMETREAVFTELMSSYALRDGDNLAFAAALRSRMSTSQTESGRAALLAAHPQLQELFRLLDSGDPVTS